MFFNGWAILIAFLLATSGIRMAERAHRTGKARGLSFMMWITLACGLYMIAAGLHMAFFAPPAADPPPADEARVAIIRFLNVMWPLALMLMGAIATCIGGLFLWRRGAFVPPASR